MTIKKLAPLFSLLCLIPCGFGQTYDLLLQGGRLVDAKSGIAGTRDVAIKTAYSTGPEWTPVEHAVEAGTKANIPVMVDFGSDHPERPLAELVTKKLRPGDIYTHCYSGLRHELTVDGKVNPGIIEGRK